MSLFMCANWMAVIMVIVMSVSSAEKQFAKGGVP